MSFRICAFATVLSLTLDATPIVDRVRKPPLEETVSSPNGEFIFRCEALDRWRTPRSRGSLLRGSSGDRDGVWRRILPHFLRPRVILVSDIGDVVTFDDWDQSPSPRSIVLFDKRGTQAKTFTFDDLVATTEIAGAEFVRNAKPGFGLWMSDQPRFAKGSDEVLIPAGGRLLRLNLRTQTLSVQKSVEECDLPTLPAYQTDCRKEIIK